MKKRTASQILITVLIIMLVSPLSVFAETDDYDYITNHINIAPAKELAILYPTKNIETTAAGFQITGTSNPKQKLSLNGELVDNRGDSGTFAIYVTLKNGANVFTFQQGNEKAAITITKGSRNSPSTALSNSDATSLPLPQFDLAVKSGQAFVLKCYAPNAESVTGIVDGKAVSLTKSGYYFTGKFTIPDVNGTVELGQVTYDITNPNGSTDTKVSDGGLYAVGRNDTLQIQVKSVATTIFKRPSLASAYLTTAAKICAVDTVTEINGNMYKLGMGGWIYAKTAKPLTQKAKIKNTVESVSFSMDDNGETFTLNGTSNPIYSAIHTSSGLKITFYNTSGINKVDISKSKLFSGATVTENDGNTTITFTQASAGGLWGYLIEYDNGVISIFCKYPPRLSSGATPLNGVTIAVDAGHGGKDPGALGITYGHGTTEKDINLATAIALQKKLVSLGADVIMLREDDISLELDPRMKQAQEFRVDFMVSLHSNSVGYSSTAATANGIEVYYFDPISKSLAQAVEPLIATQTGRKSRGVKYSNFIVTLNSYAPSILVEMGFMLNPYDFDSMCSKKGIYDTVTAISDGIIATMK